MASKTPSIATDARGFTRKVDASIITKNVSSVNIRGSRNIYFAGKVDEGVVR